MIWGACMKKTLLVASAMLYCTSLGFAQNTQSTINKCDNGKDPIVYTEFDCPEGYEVVTEGWLSETNVTSAEKFGNDEMSDTSRHNSRNKEQILE